MPSRTAAIPHIRWSNRSDLPSIVRIERASFREPCWGEEDFTRTRTLRQRNCMGMVAEQGNFEGASLFGFVLWSMHDSHLSILNLAVDPACRHKGVGAALVRKLIAKLSWRRPRLVADVRETNLGACLFFKAMGMRAVEVVRGQYRDSGEDAYRFVYALEGGT